MNNDNAIDIVNDADELTHYGTPQHSGRYPWGSGDNPYQNSSDFLSRVKELEKEGMDQTEIAESFDISTTRLRALKSLAIAERRRDTYSKVKTLKEEGLGDVEIADKLGLKGESTVRSILKSDYSARLNLVADLSDNLRKIVDERGMIDIGVGVERQLGVTKEKMDQALELLKEEGYEVWGGGVPQATNKGQSTRLKILCPPGTPHKDIYNYGDINTVEDLTSYDDGKTFKKSFRYPESLDSKRVSVRYAEDGGEEKDGLIELRRGVDDISLGTSNYSQVRILVDGTHYLKGMAVYSDNIPDGVDVVFNTNKKKGTAKMDTMKTIKDDPENPFGSSIKETGGQSEWTDENGVTRLTVINKRSDEGDWGEWSKEISAQFLSKQPQKLINRQIDIALKDRMDEYDEISSLTNPIVKKTLLTTFSDDCDATAVSLKAAGLPGANYRVILPVPSLKDNQVYAPHLPDGSHVALVRYPHGGPFEIPIVRVNNRNKNAIKMMTKNPDDAIGINSKVASILSGADFDGDTVMVIPLSDKINIKSVPPLFDSFDPVMAYGPDEPPKIVNGMEVYSRGGKQYPVLSDTQTQHKMGRVSNLITDMTLIGATNKELERAVKHSMVIIDANKHHLDYKQSEVDNGIMALHKKYQTQIGKDGRPHTGAATLISKAGSTQYVPERRLGAYFHKDTGAPLVLFDPDNKVYLDKKTNTFYDEKDKRVRYIDPKTGEKLYTYTDREYLKTVYRTKDGSARKTSVLVKDGDLFYKDEDGGYVKVTDEKIKAIPALTASTKMAETKDARTLSTGTAQEEAYANYANQLKALGNEARKDLLTIINIPYSPLAKQTYKDAYDSLDFKRVQALMNVPRERHAQTIAASIIKIKKQENPHMTKEQETKMEQQEISKARIKVGASRKTIDITDREWEAIQAGAISTNKLEQILKYADLDVLRQYAMPRTMTVLSPSKIRRIENLARSGHTTSEIAKTLGVSVTTVANTLKGA